MDDLRRGQGQASDVLPKDICVGPPCLAKTILRADKLTRHRGRAVVENHGNDFAEIAIELLECLALAMRTRESRNMADSVR